MENNYNSDSITIKELPRSFVDKYGDMKVVTPKGNATTLREAYTKYGDTPVLKNNVPHLTDFLLTQEQNDIATAREVELAQQHRANQEFNRQMDNFWGFNWIMPHQIAGTTLRNLPFTNQIYTGGNGFFRDLLFGTNGVVTDKFASKHPFLSTVANIAFDFSPAYPHIVKSVQTKGINLTNRAIRNYDIKQLANEINKVKPVQQHVLDWINATDASTKNLRKFKYANDPNLYQKQKVWTPYFFNEPTISAFTDSHKFHTVKGQLEFPDGTRISANVPSQLYSHGFESLSESPTTLLDVPSWWVRGDAILKDVAGSFRSGYWNRVANLQKQFIDPTQSFKAGKFVIFGKNAIYVGKDGETHYVPRETFNNK